MGVRQQSINQLFATATAGAIAANHYTAKNVEAQKLRWQQLRDKEDTFIGGLKDAVETLAPGAVDAKTLQDMTQYAQGLSAQAKEKMAVDALEPSGLLDNIKSLRTLRKVNASTEQRAKGWQESQNFIQAIQALRSMGNQQTAQKFQQQINQNVSFNQFLESVHGRDPKTGRFISYKDKGGTK